MPHDLEFWKDVYRDALRELIRVEGAEILTAAPRTARLCASIARESDLALAEAKGDGSRERCKLCNDLHFVFPENASPDAIGDPCPLCNPKRTPTDPAPPPLDAPRPALNGE